MNNFLYFYCILLCFNMNNNRTSELWMAWITNSIVVKSLQLSKERCPACKENLSSPLLHYHIQLSLLDKMKCYFEETRGPMVKSIEQCFDDFAVHIGLKEDGSNYYFLGQTFLLMATAESLYYGRYVDEGIENELYPKAQPDAIHILNGTLKRPLTSSSKSSEVKKKKIVQPKMKRELIYNFEDYE